MSSQKSPNKYGATLRHVNDAENANSTIAAACHYADLGFSVIPLAPNSKRPALDSWAEFQQRRPNLDEIQTWWGNGQQNGIAVICGKVSGIVVLDIDDPDKFGVALNAVGETLPDTPIARTRKGWHVYFRYPPNRIVRRHDRLADWGAELRGDGCYIVAPPTVIDGHKYHWARRNGKLMALGQVPIADCPEWLLDAFGVPLADKTPNEPNTQPENQTVNGTLSFEQKQALKAILVPHWVEGQRHELALGFAGLLAKSGIAQDDALALLREIADEAKDNEWKDRERALQDTFDRLWRGETVIGFKRLEEIVGERTAQVIASIVSPRQDKNGKANAAVELLTLSEWNEKLAHITQGRWLVEGLLQAGWLFVLNARPKVGKSIIAVNLATALANGTAFLNRPTNPCAVVYIDLERPIETLNRFKVLGALDNPNIFVPAERVGADLLDTLRDLIRQAQTRTNRPVVVFVDTLGDFIKPALRQRKATINDYDAIAEILQSLRDLAMETGCAFVFVHHLRKAQSDEPSEVDVLGSTAITGKFDVIAHLHPDRTDASVLLLVAEGNAIAKTAFYFAIEDNFRLTPCEPPAKTKEERAAREIRRLLERHPEGLSRSEIVRFLCDIGLAETPEGAQSLFRRAVADLKLETQRSGHRTLYRLPTERLFEPAGNGQVGQDIEVDQFDHVSQKPKQNKANRNGHATDQNDQLSDAEMVNMVNMVNGGMTNLTNLTIPSSENGQTGDHDDHIDDHIGNANKTRRFGASWSNWSNPISVDQLDQDTDPLPEAIDFEAFAAETENSLSLDATANELIDTEELLASLEPKPTPTDQPDPTQPDEAQTRPDHLACFCGGRLKAVGRTYKCSRCDTPLPAFCRQCGAALKVTNEGQAECFMCGLSHFFDRSRKRWLSDLDPF